MYDTQFAADLMAFFGVLWTFFFVGLPLTCGLVYLWRRFRGYHL